MWMTVLKINILRTGLPALVFLILSSACVTGTKAESIPGGPNILNMKVIPRETGPGFYTRTFTVDNRERSYTFYVPSAYTTKEPMPFVLNFHGGGGNSDSQRLISRMDQTADRQGFIVVYPQGTNKKSLLGTGFTWNAGSCCGWAQEHAIDDVKYTNMMLDSLEKELNIDSHRVYATGISNGAMMCYRLACEMANRIAAIAPVSGPMGMSASCTPSRPISIIHFHGTDDQFAPYAGGAASKSLPGQKFESVKNTIAFWQKALGLQNVKPNILKKSANVTAEEYHSDKAELVLYTLIGGGHTWPGGQFGILGEKFLGKMNMEISASETMWEFFKRHSLP